MPPMNANRALLPKLDTLRLLVAQEIICNSLNTNMRNCNIRMVASVFELCEQYSLKIFLNWLAYKAGFPVYAGCIYPNNQAESDILGAWNTFRQRYPFYYHLDAAIEERVHQLAFAYLNENISPQLHFAGSLYMRMLAAPLEWSNETVSVSKAQQRRGNGEFYTPMDIVELCLEPFKHQRELRVFDPSCGTGNFLLGTIDAIYRRSERAASETIEAVSQNIFGCDIDGRAISVARALILISLSGELSSLIHREGFSDEELGSLLDRCMQSLARNICVRDSLLIDDSEKFDLVITNPPYISFGSRNQTPMAKSQDRYLRREFTAAAEYKIRMHSLFQEIAIRKANDNGDVVLLVPDAFLNGAYYQKLRRFIGSQTEIVALTELSEKTFFDATAGKWCIAHYKRKPQANGDYKVALRRINEAGQKKEFCLPFNELVTPDKERFQLVFSQDDLNLLLKMQRLPSVSAYFRGHTGVRARNGQRTIVADSCKGSSWQRGIVSGSQVRPFEVEWQGDWLHIDPRLLFSGGHDPAVVGQPKVLIRQTADRLIGALDESGYYYLNNVHSFVPKVANAEFQAAFFTALVNSRLWLYLYRLKSREEKRALAQIDIEMVESLPLPPEDLKVQMLVAKSVYVLRDNGAQPELFAAIDRVVYGMYGLRDEEIAHIEHSLNLPAAERLKISSDGAHDLLESIAMMDKANSRFVANVAP